MTEIHCRDSSNVQDLLENSKEYKFDRILEYFSTYTIHSIRIRSQGVYTALYTSLLHTSHINLQNLTEHYKSRNSVVVYNIQYTTKYVLLS